MYYQGSESTYNSQKIYTPVAKSPKNERDGIRKPIWYNTLKLL